MFVFKSQVKRKTPSCRIYEKTKVLTHELSANFSPLVVILWTYFKYSQLELQMSIMFQPQTTPFIFVWDHTQYSPTILNKHLGQMAHPSALYKEEFVKGPKVWCMKIELDLKDWACQGNTIKSRKCFTIFAVFSNAMLRKLPWASKITHKHSEEQLYTLQALCFRMPCCHTLLIGRRRTLKHISKSERILH